MRRVQGSTRSGTAASRLPPLLFALAAAGAAAAQQAAPAVDDARWPAHASVATYRVINLGAGQLSALPKINAKGQVVFSTFPGPVSRGYFYDGAVVRDIGTLGGAETVALDLNNAGQVTGGSYLADGSEHAFVWSAGAGMLDLGVLPGAANARGMAINEPGVVTGTSEGVPVFFPHAFRWSRVDGIENLGAFASWLPSFGTALNDAGLITGNADTPDNRRHAFAWTRGGGLLDIDTLGSAYSEGVAVGARGEVAGNRLDAASGLYRAFFWTRAGGMRDLGAAGGTESFVMAMSPNAQVAALVNRADGAQRAAYWTRAGGLRQIGTLGGLSSRVLSINDKGQLVGLADDATQASLAFLWSARTGMLDLNRRLRHAPPGLVLDAALAINDSGAIVASSNAGLVLLKPGRGNRDGHAVGPIEAPELARVGAPVQASVAWVDPDGTGTRSIAWSWGDGSGGTGKMRLANGAGSARASHSYAAPGIYPVTATIVDGSGRSTAVSQNVVVTAPGDIAGQGAMLSPLGADLRAPRHVGKARFSLVVPAAAAVAGASTARGQGRLWFDLPGLNLRSDDLRLVGREGGRHLFEGSATNGGAGGYRVRLAATAGAPGARQDRFGLTVWRTDPGTRADTVVYDSLRGAQAGGALVEGSIAGR
ncbi:PKD domain-containing protein [Massilia sp.]|uniref:PKD domain-containing protein n=1 Tax=Massilia sp. TaxID=1882437 RepID=UPI0028AA9D30|nr:PKD domain-containing protein [Massilia sp.]